MSKWLEYASQFEEGVQNQYYEVRTAYQALLSIKSTLEKKSGQMIFLLGQPGSGKTYLLNYILKDKDIKNRPILFETPVLTPKSFLIKIIKHMKQEPLNDEIEVLKEQAEAIYADRKTLIMLDEAQLLGSEMLEFIRIMSDSKIFWIVCAMHEEEGREILQKPHFKSRPHKLIELGKLSKDEAEMYVNTQLIFSHNQNILDFHQKQAKKIYKLSNGNFRYLKKLIFTEFTLLHEAQEKGLTKFAKPSKCLLNMAAIDIGLLNA